MLQSKYGNEAGITVADFNNDHIPDLAIGCGVNDFDHISVLLGRASGGFQPPIITSIASVPVFSIRP